ncbi:MAG: DUF5688 family protein [Lachnospiraceae bacterium]
MYLSYENFCQNTLTNLKEQLDSSFSVSIAKIEKNNHIILDGLTIQNSSVNISPTFYLNYYYEDYTNGANIEDIAADILKSYHSRKKSENMDLDFFTDFEQLKDKVVFKLVNYNQNMDLLQKIPHIRFLDLAVVFYYLIHDNSAGNATILIRNNHMQMWGASPETLYGLAFANTPHLLSSDLKNMSDVLSELMGSENISPEDDVMDINTEVTAYPMHVLSNQYKFYGAASILYPDLLKNFANEMDSDLYILPSSIHEVILIPAEYGCNIEELNQMVQDVNATQVAPEEILSDHVYLFSKKKSEITM